MAPIGWLTRSRADVPRDSEWLTGRERRALAALRVPSRREDWRLGRYAAKSAVAAWTGVDVARAEILAAADGAPEAHVGGVPSRLSVSLSHRAGRAVAVVADLPTTVGCDLELIEPRSDAFVVQWLSAAERAVLPAGPERAQVANLLWSAKEAAAKVRREGLRLPVGRATAVPDDPAAASPAWRALSVLWGHDDARAPGWWRTDGEWVITVAADRPVAVPTALDEETTPCA